MQKKTIQTFKAHFVAILNGVDQSLPLNLWDRILPQAEKTLNLLRQSKVAPKVSAYAYLYGPHDYNRMPLAPLGCAVQMHNKPQKRTSWGNHAMDGWYIGTSDEHYRCFRIYHKETRAERTSDTVFFKHKYLTMPTVTRADRVLQAAKDLTQAIQHEFPTALPATNIEELTKLANIFQESAKEKRSNQKWNQEANPRVRDTVPGDLEARVSLTPHGTPAPRVTERKADESFEQYIVKEEKEDCEIIAGDRKSVV